MIVRKAAIMARSISMSSQPSWFTSTTMPSTMAVSCTSAMTAAKP
jgi:hypothetical protein